MFEPEDVSFVVTLTSGGLASLFNFVLLLIIVRVRSKHIGQYCYLLFFYTASAFLYSVFQLLGVQTFFATSSGYLFFDTAHFLPRSLATVNTFFFGTCYVQNIVILTVSFVYRYCVVGNQSKLYLLHQNGQKISAVCIAVIGFIMFMIALEMTPSEACDQEFGPDFERVFGFPLSETGYLCAAVKVKGDFNWGLARTLGAFSFLVLSSALIIGFCTVKIFRAIGKNAYQSTAVSQNQKKIFTLLLLQLAMPFVFNSLPLQIVLISSYLHIDVSQSAHYLGAVLSIAQVVDPILTLIFIKPYRVTLWKRGRVYSSFRGSTNNISVIG